MIGILLWLIAIWIAYMIGASKGRATAGLLLGIFLSWIGVLIIACMQPSIEEGIRRAIRFDQEIDWGPPKGPRYDD